MIAADITGLAAERQARIRELLKIRGIVRVDELSADLGVSSATIRRDLLDSERRGHLRRVHGGAVSTERRLEEPLFDDKAELHVREKQRIAEAALARIGTHDSIYLDGGSTVLALARLLTDMSQVTVVTNSLRVAGILSGAGPRVIVVGGELRRLSQTFVGPLTQHLVEQLRVDTAFMGTIGFSAAEGLSTTDPREAFTKKLVMQHAGRVVLLADSSKLGVVSFVKVAAWEDVDVLITDRGTGPQQAKTLKRGGKQIVMV